MQDDSNLKRTPLPLGKTVIEVFGDFLKYLFACARRFLIETHPNGDSLWNSVEGRIEFILSHPNGWEGSQQGKMRQATIAAGLIPDNAAGHARIHFVTEGEASMHYCVDNGLATGAITVCCFLILHQYRYLFLSLEYTGRPKRCYYRRRWWHRRSEYLCFHHHDSYDG